MVVTHGDSAGVRRPAGAIQAAYGLGSADFFEGHMVHVVGCVGCGPGPEHSIFLSAAIDSVSKWLSQ